MTSFGKNLKQLRTERKLSQGELAELVHMHPTHISRYERNQTNPTIDVVRKIAEALTVSADQLIYGDQDQMAKSKIQDNELLNMFNKVQELGTYEINCVKSLLDAYLMKSELQKFMIK